MSLDDQVSRERSSTIDKKHLKAPVEQNTRQSVTEIPQIMGVNISVTSGHLKRISIVKKLDKWF